MRCIALVGAVALGASACTPNEHLSIEVPAASTSPAPASSVSAVTSAVTPARVGDLGPPGVWGQPIDGASLQQLAALEWVNWYRAQAGLSAVELDEALDRAASAHAGYVAAHLSLYDHGLSLHEELAGLEGFTGEHFYERLEAAGSSWLPLGEVVAWQPVAAAAVRQWVESVYHRIPVLAPDAAAVGYGLAARDGRHVTVLEVGRRDGTGAGAPVVWPPDGATDVPVAWDGEEVPAPPAPPQGFPSGPVLSVTVPGANTLVVDDATLLEDAARPVPLVVVSAQDDDLLKGTGTAALYATAPLAPGRTYRVFVKGRADSKAFDVQWAFETRASGQDCDLQAQDCGPGQGCYAMDGHPVCAWAGAGPEGAPCTYQNDCMPGTTCVLGQCRRLCQVADSAGGASCGAACPGGFAMLSGFDGVGVCEPASCTPLADTCPGEAACLLDGPAHCASPGTLTPGAPCEDSASCPAGTVCATTAGGLGARHCLVLCDASPLAGEPTHPFGLAASLPACASACPGDAFAARSAVGLGVCASIPSK